MADLHNPTSELVAVSYLRSISTSVSSVQFGTTLPEDTSKWVDGFVQVVVVGGAPSLDFASRHPMLQVDVWIPAQATSKPAWGRANTLAENVVGDLYAAENIGTRLALGTFKDALVSAAYPVSEPRRVSNDPAGHARYTFDVVLNWTVAEESSTSPTTV